MISYRSNIIDSQYDAILSIIGDTRKCKYEKRNIQRTVLSVKNRLSFEKKKLFFRINGQMVL
jgi:hypothetical protein